MIKKFKDPRVSSKEQALLDEQNSFGIFNRVVSFGIVIAVIFSFIFFGRHMIKKSKDLRESSKEQALLDEQNSFGIFKRVVSLSIVISIIFSPIFFGGQWFNIYVLFIVAVLITALFEGGIWLSYNWLNSNDRSGWKIMLFLIGIAVLFLYFIYKIQVFNKISSDKVNDETELLIAVLGGCCGGVLFDWWRAWYCSRKV